MEIRPIQQKKSSFSLSNALSLVCRAAIGDNALHFYQVGTCREHSAVMELTAMENYVVGLWYMLVPLIRLNAAEDFQWTKHNPGSFYYGTFPAGTVEQKLTGAFTMLEMYLWVCARKGPTGFLVLPGKWQKQTFRLLQNVCLAPSSEPSSENPRIHRTLCFI